MDLGGQRSNKYINKINPFYVWGAFPACVLISTKPKVYLFTRFASGHNIYFMPLRRSVTFHCDSLLTSYSESVYCSTGLDCYYIKKRSDKKKLRVPKMMWRFNRQSPRNLNPKRIIVCVCRWNRKVSPGHANAPVKTFPYSFAYRYMSKGNASGPGAWCQVAAQCNFKFLSYKKIMGFYNGNADWPLRGVGQWGSIAITLAAGEVHGNKKPSWQGDYWMDWIF